MSSEKPEHIICAAIYVDDGKEHAHQPKNIYTGYVVCGRRHHNCYATIYLIDDKEHVKPHIQGFLTSKDRFVNRQEAAEIAVASKQVWNINKALFSEDLY